MLGGSSIAPAVAMTDEGESTFSVSRELLWRLSVPPSKAGQPPLKWRKPDRHLDDGRAAMGGEARSMIGPDLWRLEREARERPSVVLSAL